MGNRSPGRTTTMSPATTAAIGTSISPSSRSTRACFRTQRHQGADGGAGGALGPGFQPAAEQHQGDDDGGGLEIGVAGGAGGDQEQAVEIGRGGAERDQQVHVAGAGAQRLPGGDVEAPADDELHRRGQQQGSQPGSIDAGHRQQQRDGQHEAADTWISSRRSRRLPLPPSRAAFGVAGQQVGVVAGVLHGADQRGRPQHQPFDRGPFGRQVDLGPHDAGHFRQGRSTRPAHDAQVMPWIANSRRSCGTP